MTCHVVDEAELQGSGSDFLAAHRDSHRGRVDEDVAGFTGWRVMGASQYGSDHQPDFSRSQRNADAVIGAGLKYSPVFIHFVVGKQHDACPGQSRTLPDLTAEINSISVGQLRRNDQGRRTLLLGDLQRMRRSESFETT
jgi:hypothetical protein